MKVITLVPARNENWILPFSINNWSLFSDEIIILDDRSQDDSAKTIAHFPKARLIQRDVGDDKILNLPKRRKLLLEEGRRSGGTHFLYLDADETASSTFILHARQIFNNMRPGQALCMPWMTVYEMEHEMFTDAKERVPKKAFGFMDDGKLDFIEQEHFIEDPRVPGNNLFRLEVPFEEGFILHFQLLAKNRIQLKQAWNRMNELLEEKRSPERINATFRYSIDRQPRKKTPLADEFTEEYRSRIDSNADSSEMLERILKMFEEYGIERFEPLEIWHIASLRERFEREVGRTPRSKSFPDFILRLNDQKNTFRNYVRLKFGI